MNRAGLWTAAEVAAATGGRAAGDFTATGVAFDSREVEAGDLFVAMRGEASDGHRFLDAAFAAGAAGVIASEPCDGPHVAVADGFAALQALGRAARVRTNARVIGVTGSVGKTGTKEALWAALDRGWAGQVHRSVKSYNNHTGVPLSLARTPRDAKAAVFEMGMNHAGELAELTAMVRPHVAVVTAIAPAHTAFFPDEAAIADAKGEIFRGLEPGGTAVIPFDSPHRDRLIAAARPHAAHLVTFGTGRGADVRAADAVRAPNGGTLVHAQLPGGRSLSFAVAHPGAHWVSNALAVLAAADAVGADLGLAGLALGELAGLAGRGRRFRAALPDGEATVIDESYNANPASVRATLAVLAQEPGRRVAVLGEMRELGQQSDRFHAELAEPLLAARVEAALLVGEAMVPLARALEGRMDFVHVPDTGAAIGLLPTLLRGGDAVLVKGSNGVGLSRLVAMLGGS
jgi:UDP-N-acetylmuramoyl-tripeptide--D-alanyl-D-alanine ligase